MLPLRGKRGTDAYWATQLDRYDHEALAEYILANRPVKPPVIVNSVTATLNQYGYNAEV